MNNHRLLNWLRVRKLPPDKYRLELNPRSPFTLELQTLGFEITHSPILEPDQIVLFLRAAPERKQP